MLFTGEAFATDFATERSVICMWTHVIGQMLFSGVFLATDSALMRCFTWWNRAREKEKPKSLLNWIQRWLRLQKFRHGRVNSTCVPHVVVDIVLFAGEWFLANVATMWSLTGVSGMHLNNFMSQTMRKNVTDRVFIIELNPQIRTDLHLS